MIRPLTPADLPGLMRLKEAAGWNQTEADWLALLALEPDGCWGYEVDGVVAGTTTVARYGAELAWIGMVLTLPEYRRRGIARTLMRHALADCEARGIACVKLDATDLGRPLYADLGFEDEQPIERWEGTAAGHSARQAPKPSTLEDQAALDCRAFGVDRSRLLESCLRLASGAAVSDQGYALARAGSDATFLGPCVAETAAAARELIERALAAHPGEPGYWDLLPGNTAAVELARGLGFGPRRRLTRMVTGRRPADEPELVFATAGFEYG